MSKNVGVAVAAAIGDNAVDGQLRQVSVPVNYDSLYYRNNKETEGEIQS